MDEQQPSQIILADTGEQLHRMPEQWLRARVRGWMEINESPDFLYWIGTYTADGKWIFCSSNADRWAPKDYRQLYAQEVCRHLDRQCAFGGAWLAGWVQGGRVFYMLWKDKEGDIQIPIECDKPFIALQKYTLSDWERHCCSAYKVYSEWKRDLEMTNSQQVNVAQGEKTSPGHLAEAPDITLQ
ncbi:MAG: hypothetical protein Q8P46_16800 [Hyphomicrobiales bacterium]|nr:hypothetical protein [Hyphomicrobiales bacterium]